MKNSKGISLIALIITIIVIIILAAIVIGGVFNTPNDANFAKFCQEYDRIQTAIQVKYYDYYLQEAINSANTNKIYTHYDLYYKVAKGEFKSTSTNIDGDGWVLIESWGTGATNVCEKPGNGLLETGWYLRMSDGKLAYKGFEKSEADMYYTPNIHVDNSAGTKERATLTLVEPAATKPVGNNLTSGTTPVAVTGLGLN